MADNNRNRNRYSNNENWDKNQGRYVDDNNYHQQGRYDQSYHDLDRDGFIGNTGGFYGGTSYTGSNYDDWNNNGYMRPVQYNDQNDHGNDRRDYEGRYKQNQYRNLNDNNYQDYRSYGQYSNYGDDRMSQMYNPQSNSGDYGYNRSREDNGDYGNRYSRSNYGNDTGYNRTGYSDRNNYNNNYRSTNRNWQNDQHNSNDRNNRNNDRDWWDKTRDEVASWFGDDDAERRRRQDERRSGEHKGKGPRQYRRSNERIKEDVCDRLSDDTFIDASDIEVQVENNEVTLNGTVDSRTAKRRAEDLIESVSGVKNVQNNLRISPPATVGASTVRSSAVDDNKNSNRT